MATKSVPEIPATVYSILGPIPVEVVPELVSADGDPLLGKWVPEDRVIKLRGDVSPLTMYVTLWHESIHAWLWDAGTMPGEEETEERICDSLSSAIVGALLIANP